MIDETTRERLEAKHDQSDELGRDRFIIRSRGYEIVATDRPGVYRLNTNFVSAVFSGVRHYAGSESALILETDAGDITTGYVKKDIEGDVVGFLNDVAAATDE